MTTTPIKTARQAALPGETPRLTSTPPSLGATMARAVRQLAAHFRTPPDQLSKSKFPRLLFVTQE